MAAEGAVLAAAGVRGTDGGLGSAAGPAARARLPSGFVTRAHKDGRVAAAVRAVPGASVSWPTLRIDQACRALRHRRPIARSAGVVVITRRGSTIEAQDIRDRRSPMNTALLVLRIIPGLLLMGHGLQKIVPPGYSPPLLHAAGHRHTGAGFESLGIRPAVAAAVLAGSAELIAGFSLAAGLLTPVGTVLVGAVMITAILKVHVSNGIWAAEGGFEFPLVLLTVGFVVTALGPGSLSVDSWLGIDNWAGINWTINPAARSAIALAVGLAGGLVVALASRASKRTPTHASPQAAR